MADNLNASGEIRLSGAQADKELNKIIDDLVNLGNRASPIAAKGLDKVQKGLVGLLSNTNVATTANKKFATSTTNVNQSLNSQRYALYDVATTWGAISAATLGAAIASEKVAIDYQKNFASVARTTGATGVQLEALRQGLIDLSTAIPSSFEDITKIATLGGQLNIPTIALKDFTKTVAEFSATTNVSIDASATALGRLAQMTDAFTNDGVASYNKLGSAILKTGVNSVATESQIIAIATRIATAGDLAGFSASQIIALSSAFASLNIQPQRAQGSVQRIFGTITASIASTNANLYAFAKTSNMTAEEFTNTWKNDPQKAFSAFINGLGQIQQAGGDTNAYLKQLGIGAVRDIQALQTLANNTEVYTQALKDSNSGYADGTELQKQYAITAGTVAAKLTMLGNTFKAILEASSGANLGPIAGVIDLLENFAQIVKMAAGTGAGQAIGTVVLAVMVLIGVLTGLRAMQALTTASAYAFVTANTALDGSMLRSSGGMAGMIKQIAAMTIGMDRATAASLAYNAALNAGAGKGYAMAAGAKAGAVAVGGLGGALKGILVTGGWLIAIGLGISILTSFAQRNQEAKAYVDQLTESLDKQSGAVTELTNNIIWKNLNESGTVEAAKRQGVGLDILAQAARGSADAYNKIQAASDAWVAANPPLSEMTKKNTADNNLFASSVHGNSDALSTFQTKANTGSASLIALQEAGTRAAVTNDDFTNILGNVTEQSKAVADAQSEAKDAVAAGVAPIDDQTSSYEALSQALQDTIDTQYEVIGGTVDVQNAIFGLGQTLQSGGISFDEYSVSGRANLQALQNTLNTMVKASGGDATELATYLAGLMQALGGYGVDTVKQLAFVQNALANLTGGTGTTGLKGLGVAAQSSGLALGQGFAAGADKAAKKAAKAKAEVKTLTDYIKDLGTVFSDAFDIRFGLTQSLDKTSESWQKFTDYTDNAKASVNDALQAILDADAKIRNLNASNQTLTYQLSVAQEYGDALRTTEILAKMAENNADLTSTQTDRTKSEKALNKAQDASTQTLTGSSVAAQEQRDMVMSLVKSYEDQIQALANTGISQTELARQTAILKQQFTAQLTQMGYNRNEVELYALAFDDMSQAIARIPRNLTINVDANPGLRAVNEFLAKIQTAQGAVDSLSGSTISPKYDESGIQKAARAQDLLARIFATQVAMTQSSNVADLQAKATQIAAWKALLNSGNYYGGGYTGSGDKYTPAGVVHKGEFVFAKEDVNQSTGLPYANALNNIGATTYQSTSNNYYGGGHVTGPEVTVVELSSMDRQLLAAAGNVVITVDGKVLANVVNSHNTNTARRGTN